MHAVIQMNPKSASIRAASPIRRMFSFRSSGENPKSTQRPSRTTSPSRRQTSFPRSNNSRSTSMAIVDLPDAGSPVNQTTRPQWLLRRSRSGRLTFPRDLNMPFRCAARPLPSNGSAIIAITLPQHEDQRNCPLVQSRRENPSVRLAAQAPMAWPGRSVTDWRNGPVLPVR